MGKKIFIVAGRLGKNLIVSKVLPIINLGLFERVYIFSEEAGIFIEGAEYINLPGILSGSKKHPLKKIGRLIYEPLQLCFYAIKIRPDFINGIYTNPKGLYSFLVSKLTGRRCIISVIGGQPEIESSFYNRKVSIAINKFILKRSHRVMTKGEKDINYLISKGIRKERIIIYNGAIDLNRFNYSGEIKDVDLIFAGHFNENKGPDRFIDICQKILSRGLPVKALMMGDGPLLNQCTDLIIKRGLSDNIKLLGHRDDVEDFFKRSRILISTSKSEGLSTAILEAMACKCTPIISDVGNNREAAQNMYNSILIDDFTDINEYVLSSIKLLSDVSLWEKLSSNAMNTVQKKYSPEAQSRLLKDTFN